jgi:hypothetical protein
LVFIYAGWFEYLAGPGSAGQARKKSRRARGGLQLGKNLEIHAQVPYAVALWEFCPF